MGLDMYLHAKRSLGASDTERVEKILATIDPPYRDGGYLPFGEDRIDMSQERKDLFASSVEIVEIAGLLELSSGTNLPSASANERDADGNIVVAVVEVVASEEAPDLSWLGEFTDQTADEHGCGKRHVRNSYDSREFKFFCPSFGCDDRGWREIASSNGWTKDQFFEAAKSDAELARNWWDVFVTVEADLGPWGTACSALGGLNWMTDEDYIVGDVVAEVIREASYEAEQVIFHRLLGGNPRLAVA